LPFLIEKLSTRAEVVHFIAKWRRSVLFSNCVGLIYLAIYPPSIITANVRPPSASMDFFNFSETRACSYLNSNPNTVVLDSWLMHLFIFCCVPRRTSAWEVARTVVAPPLSVVKCLWEVFVWRSCRARVCAGVGGVFSVGVSCVRVTC